MASSSESKSAKPRYLAGIRQTPHFRPLSTKSAIMLTNLMTAYDNAFLETAAKIQSLSSHKDFEASSPDLRSTIAELESMGYDVGALVRRLELLEVEVQKTMVMSDAGKEKIADAERKIEAKTRELGEIKVEIAKLHAKAQDKQQGIDELQKWMENLKLSRPDFFAAFSKLAKSPLV
ncbi:hypothetical protein ZOSMA_8G01640 [Zostera marina]|uniref:Uncharacterized protein n=1 Tax=Zostera marina TaxID=29655 RepID=A0A0K9NM00_ZOSMR|nr:hypothetical protein ZOSMA_8G01640 [Zostera marina]